MARAHQIIANGGDRSILPSGPDWDGPLVVGSDTWDDDSHRVAGMFYGTILVQRIREALPRWRAY